MSLESASQLTTAPMSNSSCLTLVLCVCFVGRCLSFCWPLCCLFFFDIRILITHLVSSNSSYYTYKLRHLLKRSIVSLSNHVGFIYAIKDNRSQFKTFIFDNRNEHAANLPTTWNLYQTLSVHRVKTMLVIMTGVIVGSRIYMIPLTVVFCGVSLLCF